VHRTRPGHALARHRRPLDIAASLGITDLTAAGYLVKQKDGRRNRYQIQAHLPLREAGGGNLDCSSDLVMPGPSP
jgi:hypothetical protein